MITKNDERNFESMIRAAEGKHLILMECKQKSDGKMVRLICGAFPDKENFQILPYAELLPNVKGELIDKYIPPNENDKTRFKEKNG